jgi:hypothetical protein
MPEGAMKAVPLLVVCTDWVPLEPMAHCKVWSSTSYMLPE